jgi:hypothetical protein
LLSFGAETSVFQFAIKKYKDCIYSIIVSPVVLYGCKTWSLTLKEEHRLRVFENSVLRKIFGPKRDEVTGEWRRLHKEELDDCTFHKMVLGNQIEKNDMGGAFVMYGGQTRCTQSFGVGS